MTAFSRTGERLPIVSYGGGGFRFPEAAHQGAVLIVPSGVYTWPVTRFEDLDAAALLAALAKEPPADFLLLGTGVTQIFPGPQIVSAFDAAGFGIEVMATPPACRTFNLLLSEQRHFAAALIAI
jgi:uncharacterized protein